MTTPQAGHKKLAVFRTQPISIKHVYFCRGGNIVLVKKTIGYGIKGTGIFVNPLVILVFMQTLGFVRTVET